MSSFGEKSFLEQKMEKENEMGDEMMVVKRNGKKQIVSFDKILQRLRKVGDMSPRVSNAVVYTSLAMKVIEQLCTDITTTKIDELTAEQCHSMYSIHPDYNVLASRITISCHHKNTLDSFSKVMRRLYEHKDKMGKMAPLVRKEVFWMIKYHAKELDKLCDYSRDYLLDYFGFKTLERAYLKSINKIIMERPQHMWLRVAIGIHCTGLKSMEIEHMDLSDETGVFSKVRETYDLMSQKYFTHATPTLYNAGTPTQQLSSCYLLQMESDSLDGIFNTLKECALISKGGGGIGLNIHNIRATGSYIRGTDGYSNGIVPMLRVFNNAARYVDQCVTPETLIHTTEGMKHICNCVAGETEVYGLQGDVEVIANVLEHAYSGDILTIKSEIGDSLQITEGHPVYTFSAEDFNEWKLYKKQPAFERDMFKWKDAGELVVDDYLVFPIPKYSKDVSGITCEDCYVYGLLLTSSPHLPSKSNPTHSFGVLVEKNNMFMEEYLSKRLVEYNLHEFAEFMEFNEYFPNHNDTDRDNSWDKYYRSIKIITWSNTLNLPFRIADIKDGIITKRWMNLPIEKSKYILKGLIRACESISSDHWLDGMFNEHNNFDVDVNRCLCAKAGQFLKLNILNIRTLFMNLGVLISRDEDKFMLDYKIKIPKTKETCELFECSAHIPETDDGSWKCQNIRIGDYLLSRIKNIEKQKYSGVLYDLQMTNEHNYLLSSGLVHNGGGKRKGSFAIYLEPWHADIELFLAMKRNQGNEEMKARDLFYALWISDLFMKRVKADGKWTLFCPDDCPGLAETAGAEFEKLYCQYESEGRGRKVIRAQEIWMMILDSQMETGNPYMLYKDAVNTKSNQKNLGVIKSSNLCCEITQFTSSEETAVCNLASIALPSFVRELTNDSGGGAMEFDYVKLRQVARVVTYNLNRVIDINEYPSEKARVSNMRHRPIGLGVQGLADVFMRMGISYISEEAKDLNRKIFETIYLGAVEESMAIADRNGAYETFKGSPASHGLLQFDLWEGGIDGCKGMLWRDEWIKLKEQIILRTEHGRGGLRNSLLVAPMPTASTSQILGFNECFEPITSNFYVRKTLAGTFVVANKYMVQTLATLGLWNERVKNSIIAHNGSIQHLDLSTVEDGAKIKERFLTVWEMSMKHLIDMAADRGRFVCQSQSMNLWLENATRANLTSMHFYAWSRGLKTGLYYLHTLAKAQTQQFTIEPTAGGEGATDSHENGVCENCSA